MDELDALCVALDDGGTVDVPETGQALNGSVPGLAPGARSPQRQRREGAMSSPDAQTAENRAENVIAGVQAPQPTPSSLPVLKRSSSKNENGLGALVARKQREDQVAATKASLKPRKDQVQHSRRVFQDAGQSTTVFRSSGGLRIKNPVVSSSQLTTLMESTACIRIDQLRQRIIQDTVPKRWCTIAVVGEISMPRTSEATGAQYGIWKLTDLNESMMYLYVFGTAFQDCNGSITPGTLVCVVGGKTRRNADAVTLSIDAYTQLMVLGESRDFGYCKGKTKNGDACRIPVNASRCEYCSYHVGKAYREMSSLRKELQGGSLKTAFAPNKSKLKWSVGRFQSSAVGANGGLKREAGRERLQSSAARVGGNATMGSKYLVTCADPIKALKAVRDADSKKRQASVARGTGLLEHAPIPARHLASVVMGERNSNMNARKRNAVRTSKRAPEEGMDAAGARKLGYRGAESTKLPSHLSASLPMGHKAQEAPSSSMVVLEDDVGTSFASTLSSSLPARAQAAAILREKRANGQPIDEAPAAPAFLAKSLEAQKKKLKNDSNEAGDRVVCVAQGKESFGMHVKKNCSRAVLQATQARVQNTVPPEPGSFGMLFGDVIREMQATHGSEGKVESRFKGAVESEDHANLMKRLDVLEKKDNMAQRMESITSLKVSAYRCEACSSLTERKHDRCIKEHPQAISRIEAVKRWWSCSDCKKGFSTLGVTYPRGCCVKCGSTVATFEKRSMHKPGMDSAQRFADACGNAAVASREGIAVRGVEHGKFMYR